MSKRVMPCVAWQTRALRDATVMPWRNGGGVTHELVAWPRADEWQWRVSVAQIARDGPFSRFEGVRRCFAVLKGEGVNLSVDGEDHTLRCGHDVLSFGGDQACHARLVAGPTLDFNLMVRGDASLAWLQGRSGSVSAGAGRWLGCFATRSLQIVEAGATLEVPQDTLAWRWIDTDTQLVWRGGPALCWSAQPK